MIDGEEKEIARRALQAALERLESVTPVRGCEGKPLPSDRQSMATASQDLYNGANGPVVLIMLAPVSSPREPGDAIKSNGVSNDSKTSLNQGYEQGVTHPGFEKFSMHEEDPKASAPRPCFIEPDRVCVSSGACEMRGY